LITSSLPLSDHLEEVIQDPARRLERSLSYKCDQLTECDSKTEEDFNAHDDFITLIVTGYVLGAALEL